MPNVLVLYPGPIGFRQEQAGRHRDYLRENDIRLILADDYLVEADRDFFDELVELPPPQKVEPAYRVLERYCARHDVDAVLSQSESSVLLGSLLFEAAALPGISPSAAHACVDKFKSRGELQRAGVLVPRFALARDARAVRAFAREAGFPIVLKGVASALGRLVTLVNTADEIDAGVERVSRGIATSLDVERLMSFAALARLDLGCDPRRDFLVEAFAHGDPVETDGLVVGTEPRSFAVTEQVLSQAPRFFLEGYLCPADRAQPDIDAIERTSNAAIAALAIDDAGYSIEMRIDRGSVTVIEVNGRLGWDEGFGDMFERVVGVHPVSAMLELALGSPPRIDRRTDAHCALAYSSCYEDRTVVRVPTESELEALRCDGVYVDLATYAGARMHAPPHPDVAPHLAFALASHPKSSRAAFVRAKETVRRLKFDLKPAISPE
jgi:biotin carboxylase